MKVAIVSLKSISPYSQSRHHGIVRDQKETFDDFEKRMWRDRLHADASGQVVIPPMALKNCLSEAAKFLSKKIPGKRNSTYTKHFEAGVLVMDPVPISNGKPIMKANVEGEWLFLPADCKRGSGTRVMKCYPVIPEWHGKATFYILDETINKDAFEEHLKEAGSFIGLGRFRPRNNGFYGRFAIESLEWG